MRSVSVLILLIGLSIDSLHGQDVQPLDYRIYARKITSPKDQCSQGATFGCLTCNTIGLCKKIKDDEWSIEKIADCQTGQACKEGQCVADDQVECGNVANLKFLCTATGMFPNPGDCKRFHFCGDPMKDPPFNGKCPTNYAYNPKTTYCDRRLINDECSSLPVPVCKNLNETGVVKENSSIYYICINYPGEDILYPLLFICPNGQTYYPLTRACR